MFDIGAIELLVILVVAVVVIGRDDMPVALRTVGRMVGKLRKMSAQFRSGLDSMVREAELEDMEKRWKEQNERIMREHPEGGPAEMEPTGAYPAKVEKPQQTPAERAADLKKIAEKQQAAAQEAELVAREAEMEAREAEVAQAELPLAKEAPPKSDTTPEAKDS